MITFKILGPDPPDWPVGHVERVAVQANLLQTAEGLDAFISPIGIRLDRVLDEKLFTIRLADKRIQDALDAQSPTSVGGRCARFFPVRLIGLLEACPDEWIFRNLEYFDTDLAHWIQRLFGERPLSVDLYSKSKCSPCEVHEGRLGVFEGAASVVPHGKTATEGADLVDIDAAAIFRAFSLDPRAISNGIKDISVFATFCKDFRQKKKGLNYLEITHNEYVYIRKLFDE